MSDTNPQDDKKITKAVDKIVMGLIIGGAVGSVLGMAFAPKSGKETRKMIRKKAGEMKDEFMEQHGNDIEEAKDVIAEKSKGFFTKIREKFGFHKKVKKSGRISSKQIPSEQD